jgi:beta-phosphoglucomutase-like phosphatase (HAD superfamily)
LERAVFVAVIIAILAEIISMIGLIVTKTIEFFANLKSKKKQAKEEEEKKARSIAEEKEREQLKNQADKLALNEGLNKRDGGIALSMISGLPSPRESMTETEKGSGGRNRFKNMSILKRSSYKSDEN